MTASADETVFDNARIVLADRVMDGHVVVRGGTIAEIGEGRAGRGEDCDGAMLAPGLVELHTDHVEGHYHPRPKVRWDTMAALQAHDAQIAASGITTVFDALRVGIDEDGPIDAGEMRAMGETIAAGMDENRLRADHYIHLRCEVSTDDAVAEFETMHGNPRVRLASLMDHAPGQRQFTDLETFRLYYQRKMNMTDSQFESFSAARIAQSHKNAPGSRHAIAAACRERGITLASHDDATADHVAEAAALGITVAEFPTTREAAAASRDSGMQVLMGAPNIVRGGSHSGNVSAAELQDLGHLDILSSDYVPFSLVQAGAAMARSGAADWPGVFRLLAANPAAVSGLSDRGVIAPGKRADLIRLELADGRPPVVRGVWREGARVA